MEQAIIYVHAKFELAQKFVKEKQKGEIGTLIVAGGTIHVMCPRPATVQALISFFSSCCIYFVQVQPLHACR